MLRQRFRGHFAEGIFAARRRQPPPPASRRRHTLPIKAAVDFACFVFFDVISRRFSRRYITRLHEATPPPMASRHV